MAKVGRPPRKWSEEDIRIVKALRAARVPSSRIAKAVGVGIKTLERRFGKPGEKSIKRRTVTENEMKMAETMAGYGVPYSQISKALGRSLTALKMACGDRMDIAKTKANATVAGALFERAKSGHVEAMKFWLKNRARDEWNDSHQLEINGDAGVLVAPGDVGVEKWIAEGSVAVTERIGDGIGEAELAKSAEGKALPWDGDDAVTVDFKPVDLSGKEPVESWEDDGASAELLQQLGL